MSYDDYVAKIAAENAANARKTVGDTTRRAQRTPLTRDLYEALVARQRAIGVTDEEMPGRVDSLETARRIAHRYR